MHGGVFSSVIFAQEYLYKIKIKEIADCFENDEMGLISEIELKDDVLRIKAVKPNIVLKYKFYITEKKDIIWLKEHFKI